jgi:hypothetical protein
VVDLFAKTDQNRYLQSKSVERVISGIWSSKVDHSGNLLETSTCYKLLFKYSVYSGDDPEILHRFYQPRNMEEQMRPHWFTYRVWC